MAELSMLPHRDITNDAGAAIIEDSFRADLLSAMPKLRAFAISLVGDLDRADDLVQNTILRAWEKHDKFERGTNLLAWLFTVMRNIFYSECRKWRREVEDAEGKFSARLAILPAQQHSAEFAKLRSALMQLGAEQREAILLVAAEGLSYEEAAAICEVPVGTIKSRVNRARARLAELLGHDENEFGPDNLMHAALQLPCAA